MIWLNKGIPPLISDSEGYGEEGRLHLVTRRSAGGRPSTAEHTQPLCAEACLFSRSLLLEKRADRKRNCSKQEGFPKTTDHKALAAE